MLFEDKYELKYEDAQGNEVKLEELHTYPLRILKFYLYHCMTKSIPFGDVVQSCNAKAYDDFPMSPEYNLLHFCNSDWATITAKEYDEYRVRPTMILSKR
jgi:hypothetical protein